MKILSIKMKFVKILKKICENIFAKNLRDNSKKFWRKI